jgi:hypothetical protein
MEPKRRTRWVGGVLAVATVVAASTALSDDQGVTARLVKIIGKPGKALVKVVLSDEGSGAIHKGASGDPALLNAELRVCVDATLGFFSTVGPWRVNSDKVARFVGTVSGPNRINKATIKPGKVAQFTAKDLGAMQLGEPFISRPPQQGGLEVVVSNDNDSSVHRMCANLESAERVIDVPIAGGAGRKIIWKNAAPDPGCVHWDQISPVICSPSGAFLDTASALFY